MTSRIGIATALTLSTLALGAFADRTLAPGQGRAQRCDGHVYIDDGAFKLEGQPYALKSVNYRVEIVAKEVPADAPATGWPRVVVDGKSLDLFLSAYGSYSPDNNSWCRDPREWNAAMVCCADHLSCAQDLVRDVDRLGQLGVNSVRLLMDYLRWEGDAPRFSIGRMPWVWKDFYLDLTNASHRDAVLTLIRRAVQMLGVRGVRSLLLLDGKAYFRDQPARHAQFQAFLAALSAALRDEPFLIGFDFYNEPTWSSGAPKDKPFSIDKRGARDLVATWVRTVRGAGGNARALLTIGNAFLYASIGTWDPAFLPLDFNSTHIYPPAPQAWPSSRAFVENEAYFSSLGGCGPSKCPYGGAFDGANCLIGAGPVGTDGSIDDEGAFLYKGRPETCPAASRRSGNVCAAFGFERGRDRAFVLSQATFYVKSKSGQCPAGARYDGANCVVAELPVGAAPFVYGQGAARGFYYQYLFKTLGGSARCQPPARDDGANCYVGPVPAGWEPFSLRKPLFYVGATRCGGGRIPYVVGETGLAVHDLDPATGAVKKAGQGTQQDQAIFLSNLLATTQASGFQGLQWWQHGDVHWGDPGTDHYGLFGDFRQVYPGRPVPEADAQAMRPAGLVMRGFDWLRPYTIRKPQGFHDARLPDDARGGNVRYNGVVVDQHAKGVPFAYVSGRLAGAKGGDVSLFADGRGRFTFTTKRLVGHLEATSFGFDTSRRHYPVPLVPVIIPIKRAAASELPTYAPPSQNLRSCREVVF